MRQNISISLEQDPNIFYMCWKMFSKAVYVGQTHHPLFVRSDQHYRQCMRGDVKDRFHYSLTLELNEYMFTPVLKLDADVNGNVTTGRLLSVENSMMQLCKANLNTSGTDDALMPNILQVKPKLTRAKPMLYKKRTLTSGNENTK